MIASQSAPSLFVSGTGTSVGKTVLSRALILALRRTFRADPLRLVALKPAETGCNPDPLDALALATAAGQPELAHAPGLYRARAPLAPHAATLAGEPPPPSVVELAERCRDLAAGADFALIEGAGGLLVPLDAQHTFADLAVALAIPVLLVAPDQLGVLSHVLTAHESATARRLRVLAVILMQQTQSIADDPSPATNHALLAARISAPVLRFARLPSAALEDDDALAEAARACGLLELVLPMIRQR